MKLDEHLRKLGKYQEGRTPTQPQYDEREDVQLHILNELIEIKRKLEDISPDLARTVSRWPRQRSAEPVELQVQNVGNGPAKNCIYGYRDELDSWRISPIFHCSPHSPQQPVAALVWDQNSPPPEILVDPSKGIGEVLICSDKVGRVYRFFPHLPVKSENPWSQGEPTPEWVKWYLMIDEMQRYRDKEAIALTARRIP